jgi:dolichol-phosphate mannosyltransferase
MRDDREGLPLSVVIPAYNESENLPALIDEVTVALRGLCAFEIIVVDDASEDATPAILGAALYRIAELRVLRHRDRCGQSAAIRNGVKASRGEWIATLDGDGQNDPADIPRLLDARAAAGDIGLLAGWRVERKDSGSKRRASRWANAIRAWFLRDDTPDTGCGLKLFRRGAFLELPYFDHMHRYLPALMQRAGWRTVSVPVGHRPRAAGVSKYDNLGRALVGIRDLAGVAWLIRRSSVTGVEEARREP